MCPITDCLTHLVAEKFDERGIEVLHDSNSRDVSAKKIPCEQVALRLLSLLSVVYNYKKTKKMKNTLIPITGAAMLFMALAQTIHAVPITGDIGFTGRATYDTASAGTATEVVNWITPNINGTTGAFTGIANGTPSNLTSPWFFNTTTAINSFWTVGGFSFELLSSWIVSQGLGYVVVDGTGIVGGNGYTPTVLSWSFTSQDPAVTQNPISFTFSASSDSVPDGGATVMLLGIALSGVALMKRKSAACSAL